LCLCASEEAACEVLLPVLEAAMIVSEEDDLEEGFGREDGLGDLGVFGDSARAAAAIAADFMPDMLARNKVGWSGKKGMSIDNNAVFGVKK